MTKTTFQHTPGTFDQFRRERAFFFRNFDCLARGRIFVEPFSDLFKPKT